MIRSEVLVLGLIAFLSLNAAQAEEDSGSAEIGRDGGVVTTELGRAAIEIPAGSTGETVRVTLTRLQDDHGLETDLAHFPYYYRIETVPAGARFKKSIRVALCSPEHFEEPQHSRLRIGLEQETSSGRKTKVKKSADVSDLVNCDHGHEDKIHLGLGGRLQEVEAKGDFTIDGVVGVVDSGRSED